VQQVATPKLRDGAFFCKTGEILEVPFSPLFMRRLSLFTHGHETARLD
jgi:hypothetical protein